MKRKKRFTKLGILEGHKIYENPKTFDEIWISKGQLFKIDKEGNVYPIKQKE